MTVAPDPLTATFAALADPTRRAIMRLLERGDASVAELTGSFGITQQAVSKHLKVLEQAGLVGRSRRGTARLSRLRAAPLREAARWLASYQAYWQESHDRLDEVLAGLAREAGEAGRGPATDKGDDDDTRR